MKKFSPVVYISSLAIVVITLLECVALMKGIDGKVLTASVSAITGITTFCVGYFKNPKRKEVKNESIEIE